MALRADAFAGCVLLTVRSDGKRQLQQVPHDDLAGVHGFGLMESDLAEAKKTGTIRGGRDHQIADAAKALADGAAAAAKGEEEPPDVGRSLAQLFSA